MDYTQIRQAVTYLISHIEGHSLYPEELLYFRPYREGGAVAIAPSGKKYKFTQAEIEKIAIKSATRRTDRAKSVAINQSSMALRPGRGAIINRKSSIPGKGKAKPR